MAEQASETRSLRSAVSAIASLGIGLSVAHEWAYFQFLGIGFFSLTSAQDYLRLLLEWAPITGIAVLGGVFFSMLTTRIERGRTEEEIIAGAKNKRAARLFRKSGEWAGGVCYILVCLGNVLFNVAREGVFGAGLFLIFWAWYASFLASHESTRKHIAAVGIGTFFYVPVLAFFAAGVGRDNAFSLLSEPNAPTIEIQIKKESADYATVKEDAVLVRILEKGVLVLFKPQSDGNGSARSSHEIKFIRWETLDRLGAQPSRLFAEPLACRLFGVLCVTGVEAPTNAAAPSKA
jgi:hypothetical protein